MLELNDKNGNLNGVTAFRQIAEEDWIKESVQGWQVYGDKFVVSLNGVEITFTADALSRMISAAVKQES